MKTVKFEIEVGVPHGGEWVCIDELGNMIALPDQPQINDEGFWFSDSGDTTSGQWVKVLNWRDCCKRVR